MKKVIATVKAVAREARCEVRGEDASWSVVCRSEADAQFAALRLATEVDGIAVEDGIDWRVDLVRERAIVPGPEQHRLLFPQGTRVGPLARNGPADMPAVEGGSILAATSVRDRSGGSVIVRAVESAAGAPWLEVWSRSPEPVTRGSGDGWRRAGAEEFESWDGLRDRFVAVMRREIVLLPSGSAAGPEREGRTGAARGRSGYGT